MTKQSVKAPGPLVYVFYLELQISSKHEYKMYNLMVEVVYITDTLYLLVYLFYVCFIIRFA